jgi:hypothetical protein
LLHGLCAVLLSAGVAQAKPWAAYASGPLASDAEYRKLSGRPGWMRDEHDAAWVEIQWSWREERQQEAAGDGWLHGELDTDERFAALAALPPRKLHKADRQWFEQDALRRWPLKALDMRPSTLGVVSQVVFAAIVIVSVWGLGKALDFH